ncbi:Uncharacterised protein [Vibrio cholerae]|nr:Uncharacterised protein [Vibrio cholerae]
MQDKSPLDAAIDNPIYVLQQFLFPCEKSVAHPIRALKLRGIATHHYRATRPVHPRAARYQETCEVAEQSPLAAYGSLC